MSDEINTFPVTGYEIRGISNEAIMLRLPFVSHPMQKEPDPGRNYVLTLVQAAQIRDAIDAALAKLKTLPPKGDGPKH